MDLLNTYANFVQENDKGERAAFEAAMIERITKSEQGYKMSDLMYELFLCQKRVAILQGEIEGLKVAVGAALKPSKKIK